MKALYPCLTYAGTIPFIIFSAALLFNKPSFQWLGAVEQALSVYALVIATFLAGSHWGHHFHLKDRPKHYLPLLSNVVVVVLWLVFLTVSFPFLLIIFIAFFALLLLVDHRLFQYHLISQHYFQTRCVATAIVISTLIIARAAV